MRAEIRLARAAIARAKEHRVLAASAALRGDQEAAAAAVASARNEIAAVTAQSNALAAARPVLDNAQTAARTAVDNAQAADNATAAVDNAASSYETALNAALASPDAGLAATIVTLTAAESALDSAFGQVTSKLDVLAPLRDALGGAASALSNVDAAAPTMLDIVEDANSLAAQLGSRRLKYPHLKPNTRCSPPSPACPASTTAGPARSWISRIARRAIWC